jgi:hypothetical protein
MKIVLTESQLKRLFKEDKNTNIKPGEQWFYEPQNFCLRNHNPKLKLDGTTATHTFSDGVSRIAYEQDGKYSYVPKPQNSEAYRYNYAFLDKEGNWWCNKNTGQIDRKVDLEATKRKIDAFNGIPTSTPNTRNKIPQAKTMDDVKNNRGYIIKGMRGPIVKELQKMLIDLGYDLGPQKDDGIFGESTENAVKEFQKDSGIKPKNNVYGIFGKITYEKMMKKSN